MPVTSKEVPIGGPGITDKGFLEEQVFVLGLQEKELGNVVPGESVSGGGSNSNPKGCCTGNRTPSVQQERRPDQGQEWSRGQRSPLLWLTTSDLVPCLS